MLESTWNGQPAYQQSAPSVPVPAGTGGDQPMTRLPAIIADRRQIDPGHPHEGKKKGPIGSLAEPIGPMAMREKPA